MNVSITCASTFEIYWRNVLAPASFYFCGLVRPRNYDLLFSITREVCSLPLPFSVSQMGDPVISPSCRCVQRNCTKRKSYLENQLGGDKTPWRLRFRKLIFRRTNGTSVQRTCRARHVARHDINANKFMVRWKSDRDGQSIVRNCLLHNNVPGRHLVAISTASVAQLSNLRTWPELAMRKNVGELSTFVRR